MDTGKTKLRHEPKRREVTGKILTNLDRWGATILFLRKRFVLYLEPDRVALVRGQEPIVHASVLPDSKAGDFSWDNLGAAMRDVLGRRKHRRGDRGNIDVLLSEGLCKLALVKGDTGSLSLGATLAVVALMTGHWPLLLVIAVIPLCEALSVVIQVLYFKATKGKRFFKMAPIHLHFELLGWSETQVVQRFWLIGLLAAMVGMGLALV